MDMAKDLGIVGIVGIVDAVRTLVESRPATSVPPPLARSAIRANETPYSTFKSNQIFTKRCQTLL